MFNSQAPAPGDLPSSKQLVKSTVIAAAAAAVILVTIVLPSEYGIDPTGTGQVLGLTEMGEIKTQLAEEAEADLKKTQEMQRSGNDDHTAAGLQPDGSSVPGIRRRDRASPRKCVRTICP